MKGAILAALLLALTAGNGRAAETVGGEPACLTEQAYETLVQLLARDDQAGARQMLDGKQCMILEPGLPVSILEVTPPRARIRVYRGISSQVVWTSSKAVTTHRK